MIYTYTVSQKSLHFMLEYLSQKQRILIISDMQSPA